MRLIGTSTDGKKLVEVSRDEYAVLIEGTSPPDWFSEIQARIRHLESEQSNCYRDAREASESHRWDEHGAHVRAASLIYQPLIDELKSLLQTMVERVKVVYG